MELNTREVLEENLLVQMVSNFSPAGSGISVGV